MGWDLQKKNDTPIRKQSTMRYQLCVIVKNVNIFKQLSRLVFLKGIISFIMHYICSAGPRRGYLYTNDSKFQGSKFSKVLC